ncbi:hypothetical protein TBK1r_20020 [Stieleria magnilauensis]|uniref:Uncharacterized protein n=1 Tax=Stieleria magnilauensis TaxID=2527963 RepID=A0ABX5XM50_9BACT|nr:hypothetical protein TBK1r_20020 [Planctomycetes bacterium TBK1r]
MISCTSLLAFGSGVASDVGGDCGGQTSPRQRLMERFARKKPNTFFTPKTPVFHAFPGPSPAPPRRLQPPNTNPPSQKSNTPPPHNPHPPGPTTHHLGLAPFTRGLSPRTSAAGACPQRGRCRSGACPHRGRSPPTAVAHDHPATVPDHPGPAPKSGPVPARALKIGPIPKAGSVPARALKIGPMRQIGCMHRLGSLGLISPSTPGPEHTGACPRSPGICPRSPRACHPITQGLSPITQGLSPITQGLSPITRGLSPITRGLSPRAPGVCPRVPKMRHLRQRGHMRRLGPIGPISQGPPPGASRPLTAAR